MKLNLTFEIDFNAEMDLSGFKEDLYLAQVPFLIWEQKLFSGWDEFFNCVSWIGDPGKVYSFYFPIMFALDSVIGLRLLGSIIVCDWANQVSKWYLFEDRPYWWILEQDVTKNVSLGVIRQTYMTCETGPGSPSGHAMFNAHVWYMIIDGVYEKIVRRSNLSPDWERVIQIVLWTCYLLFQVLVFLSRTYIAAHFPHQVLLGALCGLLIAKTTYDHHRWLLFSPAELILTATYITASALVSYWLLHFLDLDPDWSVAKALKWCSREDWIHFGTKPMFTLASYVGVAYGLAAVSYTRTFRDILLRPDDSRLVFHRIYTGN